MKYKNDNTIYNDNNKICPFCGALKSDIVDNKKAGCAFCYEVFAEEIELVRRRKYGEFPYKGKVPGLTQALVPVYKTSTITISSLSIKEAKKRLLDIAIKEERFEDAAVLRDEIKELENRRRAEYNE